MQEWVEAARARHAAATPGPYHRNTQIKRLDNEFTIMVQAREGMPMPPEEMRLFVCGQKREADAAFVQASWEDVKNLITTIDRLERGLREIAAGEKNSAGQLRQLAKSLLGEG